MRAHDNTPARLTRAQFRDAVFARDQHACVVCGAPAQDAHHIMERRLWSDGGYQVDNGASVCALHHRQCEQTVISVEAIRLACGITKPVLPAHLYRDQPYDKWGNPLLANGTRMRGELFHDPSVQKVLAEAGMLALFTNRVKYPRTWHVTWSEGMHGDDRKLPDMDGFVGRRVIVTEKMDGENTSGYRDFIHARSLDSTGGSERHWVKRFWAERSGDLPEDWRLCGENLYALHSIAYDALASYFLGFSVWNAQNICLSWDDTLIWLGLLDITPVPVLYDGLYDEAAIRAAATGDWNHREGYVIRIADAFPYSHFRHVVGKFVRKNHVRSVAHGWRKLIVPNQLAK